MAIKHFIKSFGPLMGMIIGLFICYIWMHKSFITPSDETGHAIGIWLISTIFCISATITCLAVCVKNWRKSHFLAINYLILILFIPLIWYSFAMSYWIINSELVERTHPGWSNASWKNLHDEPFVQTGKSIALVSIPTFFLNCLYTFKSRHPRA